MARAEVFLAEDMETTHEGRAGGGDNDFLANTDDETEV